MIVDLLSQKWFAIAFASVLSMLVFTTVLVRFSTNYGLVDYPSSRKRHGRPVPLVGGISIYLTFSLTLFLWSAPDFFTSILISSGLIVIIGIADDVKHLGIRVRFAIQVLATVVMIVINKLWVRDLGINSANLDHLGLLGLPFTVLAVIGLTNAFNMLDGLDGLASGHAIIAIATLLVALDVNRAGSVNIEVMTIWMWIIIIFFLMNTQAFGFPRIFLGDAGSLFLGFCLSWFLIFLSQTPLRAVDPSLALWCVTVPVYDALTTIFVRLRNKVSPFHSDRNHFHHMLVDRGISDRLVLGYILLLSLIFNLIGLFVNLLFSPVISIFLFCVGFIVFISIRIFIMRFSTNE